LPATTKPPKPRLSREEVAGQALAFLDEHGLDGLSMRRLAAELGVGTMTLYGHFRSKDELLDAVVDAAVQDQAEPALEGSWEERLRELMRQTRRGLARHPAVVKLRAERPVLRPEALRFCERTLSILRDAGLGPREAALAFRLLFTFVLGYASFSPAGSEEEQARQSRAAIRALPPDEFPAMAEASDELARSMAGDEAFEFGLDAILAGLAKR
jgi:AcrR family transcriptional regulator